MAIQEFKVLDRLKYRFDHILTLTIAPEPDEVCYMLSSKNPLAIKVYLDDKREAYVQSLQRIAPERIKRKLEMDLSVLASHWRTAKACSEYQHRGSSEWNNLNDLSEYYYTECLNYIAIAWHILITECEEANTDISTYVKGLTHEQISAAMEKMNLCSKEEYLKMVGVESKPTSSASTEKSSQKTPAQKAQETIAEDINYSLSELITPVCDNLVKEKLAVKTKNIQEWKFTGSVELFAYVCVLFKKKAQLSRIPWKQLLPYFSNQFNKETLKKTASEITGKPNELPAGHVKVESAFILK